MLPPMIMLNGEDGSVALSPAALRSRSLFRTVSVARDAFAKLAVCAREAVELEASGDETEALRVWADVFGDAFPEVPQQSANAAVKALGLGGSITSVGGVSTTNVGSHSPRPVRSWLGDD